MGNRQSKTDYYVLNSVLTESMKAQFRMIKNFNTSGRINPMPRKG